MAAAVVAVVAVSQDHLAAVRVAMARQVQQTRAVVEAVDMHSMAAMVVPE